MTTPPPSEGPSAEHRTVKAPWTPEQVWNLLAWQTRGWFHPFTCGGAECRADLLPTVRGWICPLCDYTQDWAHEFMALPAPPETVDFHARMAAAPLIREAKGLW